MPKYIDADKFLLDNDYFADRDFINPRYSTTLRDLVDAAPAADAVPVEWLKAQLTSGYHRLAAKTIPEAWRYASQEKGGGQC